MKLKRICSAALSLMMSLTILTGCLSPEAAAPKKDVAQSTVQQEITLKDVPGYKGDPYVAVNKNEPLFKKSEITSKAFESYSSHDKLGRCGVATACLGVETMPTEKRGKIGQVKPSGWKTAKYDCVDGKYLYNRCHLIGFQLSAENANEKNLITGTRYFNVDGMLPFENMVADYIKETNNHVMYRVTPVYEGKNLVANGVLMEAYSVEDKGDGISFCVYVYNVQPGISIDYATGESKYTGENLSPVKTDTPTNTTSKTSGTTYILNTNTKKFHRPDCSSAKSIKEENKEVFQGAKAEVEKKGYVACKKCKP